MKFLVLLFLVGCATANIYEALEEEVENVYQELMFEHSDSLKDALGQQFLQQAEDDIKTEMGKRLRETLDEVLEKIRDSIDQGKVVSEDLQNKLKEIRQKLKDMKEDIGNKAREMMEKLKEKVKDFWRDLLEKIKGNDKRSIDDEELAEFNIRDMFQKLKKLILDKVDKEKLKAKIEELFGKGSEMADSLLDLINKKGDKYKQKLLDLVDRYLKKDQEKRSLQEYWEKVKEYFKNLHIDLKEKYMKFGEWVKETFKEGLSKGKSKLENIKSIAKEFLENTKGVSKDVAVEAREFLRPYKEDLGALWDKVKDAVNDIVRNNQ